MRSVISGPASQGSTRSAGESSTLPPTLIAVGIGVTSARRTDWTFVLAGRSQPRVVEENVLELVMSKLGGVGRELGDRILSAEDRRVELSDSDRPTLFLAANLAYEEATKAWNPEQAEVEELLSFRDFLHE